MWQGRWMHGLSGMTRFRILVAGAFSGFFLFVAVTVGGLAVFELGRSLYQFLAVAFRGGELVTGFMGTGGENGEELIAGVIKGINTAIIALAAFELGMGIGKEYGQNEEDDNLYAVVRRTVTRFVSLACIALVLEALIMVIKYSQLDLAGNLGYPVAILGGSSLLVLALGGFLALTRRDERPARDDSAVAAITGATGPEQRSPDDASASPGLHGSALSDPIERRSNVS